MRGLRGDREGKERETGAQMGMLWWYQANTNMAGAREVATSAAEEEEGGAEECQRVQEGRLTVRENRREYK